MIAFWAICGLFVALALLFVLVPLLRAGRKSAEVARSELNVALYQQQLHELEADQKNGVLTSEQYESGRREIQKRLIEDVGGEEKPAAKKGSARMTAIVAGVLIPILSFSIYWYLGSPSLIDAKAPPIEQQAGTPEAAGPAQMTPEKIENMVARLSEKLAKDPQNAEGWVMLGRSYEVLNRYPEAAKAFEHASNLLPNDAQAMAEYAESLMLANKNDFHGKPIELALRALKIDPNNQKALLLAGAAASDQRDFAKVVEYWERLYVQLAPDSEDARVVANGIEGARKAALASGIKLPPSKLKFPEPPPGVAGAVMVKADLSSQVNPNDTLYIFARAANGPKMPLAILKIPAKELPLTFSLDDSLAVTPAAKLSDFKDVVVGALVSHSGNATPQKGDLEGMSKPVKLGAKNVEILIDRVVQ